MISGIAISQVILTLVVGLWLGAKFSDSPFIKFFGRNDWFVGVFISIIGLMNFLIYTQDYAKNLNLVMVVFGMLMIILSLIDVLKKK